MSIFMITSLPNITTTGGTLGPGSVTRYPKGSHSLFTPSRSGEIPFHTPSESEVSDESDSCGGDNGGLIL